MELKERFIEIAKKHMDAAGTVSFQDRVSIHREWIEGIELNEVEARDEEMFMATKAALLGIIDIIMEIAEDHDIQGKRLIFDLEGFDVDLEGY